MVSNADIETIDYLTVATPAISAYAAAYGPNSLSVSTNFLTHSVTLPGVDYDDGQLHNWVNEIAADDGLGGDDCLVIPNPLGLVILTKMVSLAQT